MITRWAVSAFFQSMLSISFLIKTKSCLKAVWMLELDGTIYFTPVAHVKYRACIVYLFPRKIKAFLKLCFIIFNNQFNWCKIIQPALCYNNQLLVYFFSELQWSKAILNSTEVSVMAIFFTYSVCKRKLKIEPRYMSWISAVCQD